jgi:hypothetical protein
MLDGEVEGSEAQGRFGKAAGDEMKHRSVMAFIIIAAALFSAREISNDLQAFKNSVGSLSGELLRAYLSLRPDDGAASPVERHTQTLVIVCVREKSDAPAAKERKSESRASVAPRTEARATQSPREQLAAVVDPSQKSEAWRLELLRGDLDSVVGKAAEARRRVHAQGEVSMIIPPDDGIDPQAFAGLRAFESSAPDAAVQKRKGAEELRRVTFVATCFDGKNIEWQKTGKEVLRKLNETLPGGYEFRFDRDGSKTRVVKVRRTGATGRPAPRAPWQIASFALAPSVNAQPLPACE